MCGIAGTFAYHRDAPPVDPEALLRVREAMAARGPDGAGLWMSADRRVGLAHRRLAIIDLSEDGAQPMHSADGRLSIVFNGEIYNFRELRKDLESRGHRFRSSSDTEVLLALWDEFGPEMVARIRGMFAFALWDAREQSLFLARDPFGIKPLYFADDGRTFRFASQVKALVAGGEINLEPDPAGFSGFYALGFIPEPHTTLRTVKSCVAGHSLRVGRGGRQPETSYFSIGSELALAEETAASDQGSTFAKARIAQALEDSVMHHLVSDVPVGIFLSSGLDSSSLLSLAKQVGTGELQTVTLGFKEFKATQNDETILAAEVARLFGTRHQTRWVTREDFEQELPKALQAMDQPTVDGLNTYFVSKVAADTGMKVALSGLGGDELFGGYPSFRQVPRLARFGATFAGLPRFGRGMRGLLRPFTGRNISPKWAGLFEFSGSLSAAYFLRRALYLPWEIEDLAGPAALPTGWEELDLLPRMANSVAGLRSERARMMALEIEWYMRSQLLRDSDWAGMAHGLEIRVPLVDPHLLRALGPLLVSDRPLGKMDMVSSLARPLPPAVLDRPKTGFSFPVRAWVDEIQGQPGLDRGLRGWAGMLGRNWPDQPPLFRKGGGKRQIRRVLIFRLGSLGDTVVAIPSFRLIAKNFPDAERHVLTNFPEHAKAPPISAILGASGLVKGYLEYPPHATTLEKFRRVRRQVRTLRPDVLVYLAPLRTTFQSWRDRIFFRLCGVRRTIGIPSNSPMRRNQPVAGTGLQEPEYRRLLRCLEGLGEIDLDARPTWDFRLTVEERTAAQVALAGLDPAQPTLAISAGTKIPVKEWGEDNWTQLLQRLARTLGHWNLTLYGSSEEFQLGERVTEGWPGRRANLSGLLTPRESAAALGQATLFIGQDSGPMHLAAAMGIPCVAIFSSRELPGVWFPAGDQHEVIYHDVPCKGCHLDECHDMKKVCIAGITVEEVLARVERALGRATAVPAESASA